MSVQWTRHTTTVSTPVVKSSQVKTLSKLFPVMKKIYTPRTLDYPKNSTRRRSTIGDEAWPRGEKLPSNNDALHRDKTANAWRRLIFPLNPGPLKHVGKRQRLPKTPYCRVRGCSVAGPTFTSDGDPLTRISYVVIPGHSTADWCWVAVSLRWVPSDCTNRGPFGVLRNGHFPNPICT